jgi:hypothetical protein
MAHELWKRGDAAASSIRSRPAALLAGQRATCMKGAAQHAAAACCCPRHHRRTSAWCTRPAPRCKAGDAAGGGCARNACTAIACTQFLTRRDTCAAQPFILPDSCIMVRKRRERHASQASSWRMGASRADRPPAAAAMLALGRARPWRLERQGSRVWWGETRCVKCYNQPIQTISCPAWGGRGMYEGATQNGCVTRRSAARRAQQQQLRLAAASTSC